MGGVDPGGHPGLAAALAAVLARCGALTAQVVDGRTSAVVAAAGPGPVPDAAAAAALTGWALRVAVADGGLSDLVLTATGAVHLIAPAEPPGAFVHVRFEPGRGDLAAARDALRTAGFRSAVRAALHRPAPPAAVAPRPAVRVPAQRPGGEPAGPVVPAARTPPGAPVRPGDAAGSPAPVAAGPRPEPREPARPALPARRAASTGVLAALALDGAIPHGPIPSGPIAHGPIAHGRTSGSPALAPGDRTAVASEPAGLAIARDSLTPPHPMPAVRPLPRRAPVRQARGAAVPPSPPAWSDDVGTLDRVLVGLRRLG